MIAICRIDPCLRDLFYPQLVRELSYKLMHQAALHRVIGSTTGLKNTCPTALKWTSNNQVALKSERLTHMVLGCLVSR